MYLYLIPDILVYLCPLQTPMAPLRLFMDGEEPLVLDGGLGTDLEAHGARLQGDPLWSSRLLHTDPQAIRDAHYRFLVAGADVITTATYQASVAGFTGELQVSAERARELMASGVRLAREALDRFSCHAPPTGRRRPLVAASVGPLGAFLHDGSEYTGAYAEQMSVEELKAWHRPQMEVLAGADLVAMETIPSIKEAAALLELLREFPETRAWLAFSCQDGRRLSDGSLFSDAVRFAQRSSQLVAVGVNCCSPALVEPLLDSIGSLRTPDLSWVVYPNSGVDWDSEQGLPAGGAPAALGASWLKLGASWLKLGAALIGGCCHVGPAHIAELRRAASSGRSHAVGCL
ncbi:homocysteine S-methyltransferase YbgG isoform X2 [Pseudoliparis swirei]|uniref:homocysteine S-methyltransferase YbgG isoform X2 n=1 Tax=Pseudoliparis swirei TaxID=2059687 RepID=UPI0024BE193A|nr:homocysteine S-methyltransferase YbgG isoform X2 [Pseudoliparis swirei]XP_056271344.1 homocysteine S-methyltransferase YbgG isoform X2 [Pseudoliparis swirei]